MSAIASAAVAGIGTGQSVYNAVAGPTGLVQFKTPGGSTICQFDLQMQENYTHATQPTQFPIETGAEVSDHIITSPFSLELACLITDTPIDTSQALITEGIATALGALTGPLGIVAAGAGYALYNSLSQNPLGAFSDQTPPTRSVIGWVTLRALQLTRRPFTVVTKLDTFQNMVITNMSVPRDAGTGQALVFNINLQQLLLVRAQQVDPATLGNAPLSAENADLGQKMPDASQSDAFTQGVQDKVKSQGFNLARAGS